MGRAGAREGGRGGDSERAGWRVPSVALVSSVMQADNAASSCIVLRAGTRDARGSPHVGLRSIAAALHVEARNNILYFWVISYAKKARGSPHVGLRVVVTSVAHLGSPVACGRPMVNFSHQKPTGRGRQVEACVPVAVQQGTDSRAAARAWRAPQPQCRSGTAP